MRWHYGETRDVYRVLVGIHEKKKLIERPRRRWKVILKWRFRKWEREH
jgi:hypothetical protein